MPPLHPRPFARDHRRAPKPVSALYVERDGIYSEMRGVIPWHVERDASRYSGPYPVVAHPPCGPWGTLRGLCKKQNNELARIAVSQVRRWGGILEHPAGSLLWKDQRMWGPGEFTDRYGGWTLQVDQVRWGHPARKRTWLYMVGIDRMTALDLPPPREATHVVTSTQRGEGFKPQLWSDDARKTPPDFAWWLVDLAATVDREAHREKVAPFF